MHKLLDFLASYYFSKKNLKNISNSEIIFDEKTNKFFIIFKAIIINKNNKNTEKIYKQNITKLIKQHEGATNLLKAFVASTMILEGYLIIPVNNGWLCTGGEEVYSLKSQDCSCPAFITNSSQPCKHLIYRDFLLQQRSKINEWKQNNL